MTVTHTTDSDGPSPARSADEIVPHRDIEKNVDSQLETERPATFGSISNPTGQFQRVPRKHGPYSRKHSRHHSTATHTFWKFKLRPADDDQPQDWWFASTAIPLLAATTGPMANVLSLAALITSWRVRWADDDTKHADNDAQPYADPHWCIALNIASLVCGFVGNFFLLLNFTRRVRYIIALPATILLWYVATGILTAITISMHLYVRPNKDNETYSQGFWYAVLASGMYMFSSMILMVNMWGYFLGHYPQYFTLTDHQRTLILQTMMFFIWLAGGGGLFARVCGYTFVNALYFCDVTILTVGFGDYAAVNDTARALVFPYSVGGIIILGLMVSSIHKFANEMSHDMVVKNHIEKHRIMTIDRAVTTSIDYHRKTHDDTEDTVSALRSYQLQGRSVTWKDEEEAPPKPETDVGPEERADSSSEPVPPVMSRSNNREASFPIFRSSTREASEGGTLAKKPSRTKVLRGLVKRSPRAILLRAEKDRFTAMREIQRSTASFKRWYALTLSLIAFGLLWCCGAIVFWRAERREQGMTYFQALYFCYVSLLTIGYGDLSPRSNIGKPFFVVWSLIAVPTMTILISDMADTVIASFKRGTVALADFTVLPKAGIWASFLRRNPWLLLWLQKRIHDRQAARRLSVGFQVDTSEADRLPNLEELADDDTPAERERSETDLARDLAKAIRITANDLHADPPKKYSYEEWVEFTRLIRFSKLNTAEVEMAEDSQGLVEWDWIGENSPMLADETESEWVLDRLCESLDRYMRRQNRQIRRLSVATTSDVAHDHLE